MKINQINEALTNPYPWRWARRDAEISIARAILPDGRELNVSFEAEHRNQEHWNIYFDVDDDTAVTGGGDQFRIFATVVDAVQKWWDLVKDKPHGERPRWIDFSSEKLEMETGKEGSKGRTKLYTRFAKQFAQKINLALEIDDQGDQVVFRLKPRKKAPRQAIEEVNVDNKDGWGAVPNNREIDYFGMKVLMKPSTFISLAAPLSGEPSEKIKAHIASGGSIGAPFLIVNVPDGMNEPATVAGHDGRNRMLAVQEVDGDDPIEVHIMFRGQISRARQLTPEIKNYLNSGLNQQSTGNFVKGPLWKVLQESMIESVRDNNTERYEFIIPRKFDEFLVVFTKEPSGNPNSDKIYYDMEGYDIDHKGRRSKSFDGRYSKTFKDEAAWRRAIARIKKKSINEDGRIVKGVNTTVDVKPGETKRQAAKFGNKINSKNEPPLLNAKARKNSTPHVLSNLGLAEDAGSKQYGYKVMNYNPDTGEIISGADSRVTKGVKLRKGMILRMPGQGIFMSTNRKYVETYYGGNNDHEAIIKFEFDPKTITSGNLTDNENEFTVPSATVVGFKIIDNLNETLKKVKGRWALVSKSNPKKVLQYYDGPKGQKPSKEWVSKVERRVHSFESTQLTELFDKGYSWSWTQRPVLGSWRAGFDTDTGDVDIIFMPASRGSQNYEVAFSKNGEVNRTNEGDQFRIFATVINIIESFMATKPGAESLNFTAKREGAAAEDPKITDSRAELYKRMVSKFAKKHDLEFTWQQVGRMTEFMLRKKVVSEEFVKPSPQDTLGVKRTEMPQVHKDHYPELIQYLKDHGGKFAVGKVNAKELKPVQSEFSDAGVEKMIQQMRAKAGSNYEKPLIVSSDNYIIDGHHRWLAAWNENLEVAIMKISIPVRKLLQLVRDFKHTTYKDIHEESETSEKNKQ